MISHPSLSDFATHDQSRFPELWAGCIGAWAPCLGPTGLRLHDFSRRNNWGTLTNMDAATDWIVDGSLFTLDLDGTDDFIDCLPLLGGRSVVTVCFFAKPFSTTSRIEVNQGASNADRCSYGLSEDGNAYIVPANTTNFGRVNWSSLGTSSFIHFAGVFNANGATNADRVKMWLNGIQRSLTFTGSIVTSPGTLSGNLRFGLRPDGTTYSRGQIDDIRIYDRELSDAEIKLLASHRGISYQCRRRRSYFRNQVGFNPAWARNINYLISPVGAA